ncbi:hypothetical protein LINPERPRIM_LOCUS18659, partial [Linum perenne]
MLLGNLSMVLHHLGSVPDRVMQYDCTMSSIKEYLFWSLTYKRQVESENQSSKNRLAGMIESVMPAKEGCSDTDEGHCVVGRFGGCSDR